MPGLVSLRGALYSNGMQADPQAPTLTADQINACATLVHKGDPDRFAAAMAAPLTARGPLFTLYALNLELARAPWVTKEPIIAQMRLQFWRDVIALEEHKAHEVAAPLQALVRGGLDPALVETMIDAREVEIGESAPFADQAELWTYLSATSGALMAASVQALAPATDQAGLSAARELGAAQGLANYLQAIPALEAGGRLPLPDGRPEAIAGLAREGLARLDGAAKAMKKVPSEGRPAFLAAWQTRTILRQVVSSPTLVADGALGVSEFSKRGGLMVKAFTGRFANY